MTMLPKPSECQGCPLYGDGQGFVPDEVVEGAEVFILAQNPGENEERGERVTGYEWAGKRSIATTEPCSPRPLIGKTGYDLFTNFAPLANIQRGQVSLGNVIKCRLQSHCKDRRGNPVRCNHLPAGKVLEQAVAHCTRAHLKIPESTRLIVASGSLAWDFLTDGRAGSITDWRGFLAPEPYQGRPVLGTLHVADLYHNPKMKLPTQLDWAKIPKIVAGKWPKPIPPHIIATEDRLGEVEDWFEAARKADFVVLDTEYDPENKYLAIIGLRAHGVDASLIFPWRLKHEAWFRSRYLGHLRDLLGATTIVFQNALADILVLQKNLGIKWEHYKHVEDTLLAHACLWTEYPHDLEFLASIYGQYPKLKHLADTDPYLYNHGDLLATEDVWLDLCRALERDPRSQNIYRNYVIPLIPIYTKATLNGVRVDRQRAQEILQQLVEAQEEASRQAMAWTGRPINVGSEQQVKNYLVTHDKVKIPDCQSETVFAALQKHSENQLLHARRRWSEVEGLRKYVAAVADKDEVHPEFLPTQATGRTSVKNPPLVNFPDDGKALKRGLPPIQSIFLPHPGHWWLCWDWSALHAREMAAACGDQEDLDAFAQGWDLHTITACRVFKLPLPPNLTDVDHPDNAAWREQVGWMPKDRRRHLMKTVRYSLLNGINEKAVRESKEVVEQGLDLDELERVGRAFLAAKPAMTNWKRAYCAAALRVGEARSLYGRRRQLLAIGDEEKSREERMKSAISGFLQMTEVDIMESTLIEACRRWPEATLVYPSHDGIKLEFPDTVSPQAVYADLKPLVEREHDFWGRKISMPAEWSVIYDDGSKERLI